MKNYILIRAYTQSQWDNVDFALIPFNGTLITRLAVLVDKAKELQNDFGTNEISIYSDEADFFVDDGNLPFELPKEDEYKIVTLTDKAFGKLKRPESINGGQVSISSYGSITFKASGKHTGEEFWCDGASFVKELSKVEAFYKKWDGTPYDRIENTKRNV